MSPTTCGVVWRGGRKGAGEGGEGREQEKVGKEVSRREWGREGGGRAEEWWREKEGRPERGGENGERRRAKEGGRIKEREWGEEIINLCA